MGSPPPDSPPLGSFTEGPPPLNEDIVEFVASGVDVLVATRDENLMPESMMAIGARAHPDLRTFTAYLPEALADATVRNLLRNGDIAITVVRPIDHKALQVKGKFITLRRSTEADRQVQALGRAGLVEQFAHIGIPRPVTRRLVWWPSLAIEMRVEHVFLQTPGPGAGELLARGAQPL
jgi:hypothetical protein